MLKADISGAIVKAPSRGHGGRLYVADTHPLTSREALMRLETSHDLIITLDKQKQLEDWACAPNQYKVRDKDAEDTTLFLIHESSNCCCHFFCGPSRATTFTVLAPNYEEVATFRRLACRCDACCCCLSCLFCNNVMEVYMKGELVGAIKQRCSIWRPRFSIYKGDDEIAAIKAPCCPCRCQFYMEMEVGGVGFGQISKDYNPSENFNSDHETFTLRFGSEEEIQKDTKIVWLAAACFMNLMYFEVS